MANKFGKTVEEIKKKIHTTRSTYNQIRIKVLEAEARNETYVPLLSWYNHASFLNAVITLRKNRDSLVSNSSSFTGLQSFTASIKNITSDAEDEEEVEMQYESSSPAKRPRKRPETRTTSIRLKVKADTGEVVLDDDGQPTGEEIYQQSIEEEQIHQEIVQGLPLPEAKQQEEVEDGGEYAEEEYVDHGIEIVQMNQDYSFSRPGQSSSSSNVHSVNTVTTATSSQQQYQQQAQKPLQRPVQETPVHVPVVEKDEIALFCDLMQNQLRALPSIQSIKAMCKIQGLVSEARLEALLKDEGGKL